MVCGGNFGKKSRRKEGKREMPTIQVNGESHEIPEAYTIEALLVSLGFSGKFVAVERNRELVPKRRHAETSLSEGDQVEIVTLVGGG